MGNSESKIQQCDNSDINHKEFLHLSIISETSPGIPEDVGEATTSFTDHTSELQTDCQHQTEIETTTSFQEITGTSEIQTDIHQQTEDVGERTTSFQESTHTSELQTDCQHQTEDETTTSFHEITGTSEIQTDIHQRTDFTATNALQLLVDCEFPIHSNWEKLARNLDISLDKRRALRKQVATMAMDYETVLEEALDMFVSNNSSPVTWEKFIFEVERVDRPTAAKMRKKLGFALTQENMQKLKEKCDLKILLCISGRISPRNYVTYFVPECDFDEIHHRCACNDIPHLSINLDMLLKWRERKGSEATYLALYEIFQKTNDEKVIDLITEYAAKGCDCFFSEPEDLHFPKVNRRMNISYLEQKFEEIIKKFASLSVRIIVSLRENETKPKDLATYLSRSLQYKFTSTNDIDINDIITDISSWFNIKVLKDVVHEFGNKKDEEALLCYEKELYAYLQQSVFHIPAESFQSNSDKSDITLCYLKIPEEFEHKHLSGKDLLKMEKHLANVLGIDCKVFNFCMYRLGCIELVFSIPTPLYQSSVTLEQSMVPSKSRPNEFKLNVDLESILPSKFNRPIPFKQESDLEHIGNEEDYANIEIIRKNSVLTNKEIIEDGGIQFIITLVTMSAEPTNGRKRKEDRLLYGYRSDKSLQIQS